MFNTRLKRELSALREELSILQQVKVSCSRVRWFSLTLVRMAKMAGISA